MRRLCFIATILLIAGCDPEGRKDCAWTLEPEPRLRGKTQEGYIPLCARNRQTMKQDCRFQWTLEEAMQSYRKTFRYTDLKVASPALPRTIVSITFCKDSSR